MDYVLSFLQKLWRNTLWTANGPLKSVNATETWWYKVETHSFDGDKYLSMNIVTSKFHKI